MVARRPAIGLARAVALVLGVSVLLLVGCGGDSSDPEPSGGSSTSPAPSADAITNSDGAFTLELPDNWSAGDEDAAAAAGQAGADAAEGAGVDAAGASTTDVYFRDGDGPFRVNVNVVAEPSPAGDFEQAVQAGSDLITQALPEAEIRSGPDPTTLDGEEAFEQTYVASPQGTPLQFSLIQADHDGMVYSVSLTSDADDYDAAAAEFQQILDSWRWT